MERIIGCKWYIQGAVCETRLKCFFFVECRVIVCRVLITPAIARNRQSSSSRIILFFKYKFHENMLKDKISKKKIIKWFLTKKILLVEIWQISENWTKMAENSKFKYSYQIKARFFNNFSTFEVISTYPFKTSSV